MPDNGAVNAFLNSFLRGDRDLEDRRTDGSVLQALSLMNDPFITSRVNSKTAPATSLLGVSKTMTASQMIDNLYISVLSRVDLEAYQAVVTEPLSVATQSGTLYNTPPPTQGLASLMILALFERLRVTEAESFDHVHGLVEATKRAFRVRDRFVTDPARLDGSPARFLEKSFLDSEAGKIDRRKAAKWPVPSGEGDTIWMGAADSSGLVVSYIQSLYWEFGSACVLPATGVLMQNRGASFSLERAR